MTYFKAVQRGYNTAGNLKEKICGYGETQSIAEEQKRWKVPVVEITQEELSHLRKQQEQARAVNDDGWSY